MRIKISVIGAGMVGATTAQRIADKNLAEELVMVDIDESVKGKALDLMQSASIEGFDTKIIGTTDYKHIENSDIIIVTAGFPRLPGMSRDDLLKKNSEILKGVAREITKYSKDAIIIVVTNPLDVMCYLMLKETKADRKRVIGMAGILDSARFDTFIAGVCGAVPKNVCSMVLGCHGDTMVPIIEETKVEGKRISEVLGKNRIEELVERTKKGGGEIVNYLKRGSAYFAPSSSIARMVEAIVKDKDEVLCCSVYLEGEYGYKDIFLGVPVKLGKEGIKEIIEIRLDKETKQALDKSAEITKKNLEGLERP